MSPSSSISSSSAGRWLGIVAAVTLAVVIAVCLANWWGIRQGLVGWQAARLQHEQLQKIAAAPRVDVVLVGDSTLGNAIDARAWSRATGLQVLSVPLTGRYGYAGSLNLLRRVLARHDPGIVIVMQAFDMPTRRVAWDGLLFTAAAWSDLAGAPLWRVVPPLANLDLTVGMIQSLLRPPPPVLFDAQGYVPQNRATAMRRRALAEVDLPSADEIRPEKQRYLREIGAACRNAGSRCIYLHGPYPSPQCEASSAYREAADRFVATAGLIPAPGTPVCLPREAVGDAEDHVMPEMKAHYSEVYRQAAASVAPELAAGPVANVRRSRAR